MLRTVALHALLALAICLAEAQSSTRQWKPNTNIDDPRSWNATALCSNDRLVFPADVKAVVFVQRNYTLQELRLPNNGIMTFGEGASLVFSTTPDRRRECSRRGNVRTFSAGAPMSWYDPENWCVGKGCVDDDSTATYVDSEIVPCQSNEVIFPERSTFSVDVHSNPEPVAVKSVVLRGTMYNSSEAFNLYYNGDVGRKEFVTTESGSRSRVSISSGGCTDRQGCICGNIHEYMEDLVCANRHCQPSLPCRFPVKADGNCCPSCGTLLNVTTGTDFNMTSFKQVLAGTLVVEKAVAERAVRWAVTKVSESKLQVLTLPSSRDDGGSSAIALGCIVNAFLQSRISDQELGITNVLVANSDGVSCDKQPSHHASTQAESTRDTMVGIMLSLAVVIVIGVLIVIYRKSVFWKVRTLTSTLENQRVRFDGKNAEVQHFDNPAYDGVPLPFSPTDGGKRAIAFDARSQTVVGFENPLYPESGATFDPEAVGGGDGQEAAAGMSSFLDFLPTGRSSSRNGGRRLNSTSTAAGIGFDNPLCTGQNVSSGVSAPQSASNGTHSAAAAASPACAPTAGRTTERLSWISKFRLPKLFASAAASTTASAKVVDDKGFSNPLYQSPTVENLSFSPAGVAYSPSAASQPPFGGGGPTGGRVAGPLLDDDFLNGAAGNVSSDTVDLIL